MIVQLGSVIWLRVFANRIEPGKGAFRKALYLSECEGRAWAQGPFGRYHQYPGNPSRSGMIFDPIVAGDFFDPGFSTRAHSRQRQLYV